MNKLRFCYFKIHKNISCQLKLNLRTYLCLKEDNHSSKWKGKKILCFCAISKCSLVIKIFVQYSHVYFAASCKKRETSENRNNKFSYANAYMTYYKQNIYVAKKVFLNFSIYRTISIYTSFNSPCPQGSSILLWMCSYSISS